VEFGGELCLWEGWPLGAGARRSAEVRFSYFSTELSFNASLLGPGAPTQEGVLKAQISQPRLASERVCARAHDSAADPACVLCV